MKLCRYSEGFDEEYGEYIPVMMPWNHLSYFIRKIRSKLYSKLDKDIKHATICKLIHRHKRSKKSIIEGKERDKEAYAKHVKSFPKENTGTFPYLPHILTFVPPETIAWKCVRCEQTH